MNTTCPRCETNTYERLKTYSHCTTCGFSSEFSDEKDLETETLCWALANLPDDKPKPWEDEYGIPLSDDQLKPVSKKWSREIWEQYLQSLEKYQREAVLPNFDKILLRHDATVTKEDSALDDDIIDREDPNSVRVPLHVLTFQQRKVVNAIFFRGMTRTEAAEHLGITYKTLSEVLHRALERLRNKMTETQTKPPHFVSKNFFELPSDSRI